MSVVWTGDGRPSELDLQYAAGSDVYITELQPELLEINSGVQGVPPFLEIRRLRRIGIDDDERRPRTLELFDDRATQTPEAADDHVVAERLNRTVHGSPPEHLAQASFD